MIQPCSHPNQTKRNSTSFTTTAAINDSVGISINHFSLRIKNIYIWVLLNYLSSSFAPLFVFKYSLLLKLQQLTLTIGMTRASQSGKKRKKKKTGNTCHFLKTTYVVHSYLKASLYFGWGGKTWIWNTTFVKPVLELF